MKLFTLLGLIILFTTSCQTTHKCNKDKAQELSSHKYSEERGLASSGNSYSCFTDYKNEHLQNTCAEYSSNNSDISSGFKQSCELNPYGSRVDACPGAHGCKITQNAGSTQIVTKVWYINNESAEIVEAACNLIKAEFISR